MNIAFDWIFNDTITQQHDFNLKLIRIHNKNEYLIIPKGMLLSFAYTFYSTMVLPGKTAVMGAGLMRLLLEWFHSQLIPTTK